MLVAVTGGRSAGLDDVDAPPSCGQSGSVGGGADQGSPIGKPAETQAVAQLRAVGDDKYAAGRGGHLRQHAGDFGRILIDGALAVDGVGAEKGDVGPKRFQVRLPSWRRPGRAEDGAQAAAQQQHLDLPVVLQLGGNRQRRGDDGQSAASRAAAWPVPAWWCPNRA